MAGVTVALVLIVSGMSYANINLLDNNTDHTSDFAEFASRAYHYFSSYCKVTLIVHDDEDEFISNYFLQMLTRQDFNMSIISLSLDGESTVELKGKFVGTIIGMTIVFWTERYYNRSDYFLDSVEKSPYWNRFSKMVIIATGNVPTDYIEWLQYTFKTFWKRKILRVFICFWMHDDMHIYMYNPFTGDFARNISNATTEQYETYLEYELIDLNGYPMQTYIYDINQYSQRVEYGRTDVYDRVTYYGLDGHFMTEVRNILNVTLHLRRESNGMLYHKYRKENRNTTKDHFFETYDLDIWFTAVAAHRETKMDLLFLHERDDLCIVVPTGAPVPQYLYIFLVIPLQMWFGIVTSLVLVAVFLHLLHRPAALLDTYRIITNVPLVDPARPVDLPERTVLATWILFALVSTGVFQCTLTSTLVLPKYYQDIETIRDVIRANLTIYSRGPDKKLLAENLRPEELALLNNIIVSSNMTLTNMIKKQGYNGFLVRSEIARTFLKYVKIRRDGRPWYHIMREHPVPNAQNYIMPSRHPYYEEMLWIINKVHESGLYYLWRTDDFGWAVKAPRFAKKKVRDTPLSGNKYVPLSLTHLQSAFFLLLFGEAVALVVFIVEFIYKMTKKN